MKQLSLRFVMPILGLFFVGCAERCFYHSGKSLEQCEHDLLECVYSDGEPDICMQAKGYEYRVAGTSTRKSKRKKVIVRFEEDTASGARRVLSKTYWITDGLDTPARPRRVLLEQSTQMSDLNAPARKLLGYKARKDDSDKFIFIPVYEYQ